MSMRVGRVVEVTKARTFTLREEEFPPPEPGRVLVRVRHVGVCVSDLEDWQEGPPAGQPALRLGHEPVGVVAAVGEGVAGVTVGQTVTGRHVPAYADYVYANPIDLVTVPDGVAPEAAIGEPLGCVVAGLERCIPEPGARTAVVGLGFMGMVAARMLVLSPAATVLGIDLRTHPRETALELGVTRTLPPDHVDLAAEHAELVVEATGTQAGLDLATRLVAEHGVLAILGYHRSGPRFVDLQEWNWKAITVVNAHVRDRQRLVGATRAALRLVAAGLLDPGRLITHRYRLDRINDAYHALLAKPDGFLKAVVDL